VGTTTNMTTVSQVNPIWAYFSISESDYLSRADVFHQIVNGKSIASPAVEFIQANGLNYPQKGRIILVNRATSVPPPKFQSNIAGLSRAPGIDRYHLARAQRDQADLTYKQTVQQAFADVSNALVGYHQSRLFRIKLQEQTATYKETSRLANVRFLGGVTSFLEVLTTQQQYFDSELQLQQAWFAEMQNYVQLYQALGGGW
jgi:hypothetical protein